jgi:predicted esterase
MKRWTSAWITTADSFYRRRLRRPHWSAFPFKAGMSMVPQRISSLSLALLLTLGVAEGATLAGQPVHGGATMEILFPVARPFQELAAEGGNPRVETGRAVITFPSGFDPARPWPILIVTSTSDFNRTSVMDAQWYRGPTLAEGWVLLATDATVRARVDSTQWRLAMLAAALEAVRTEWPQATHWPVAFAGFSGGAKRAGVIGAMLARTGSVNVCGFFLSGINSDRLSEGYNTYRPKGDFLSVPIWLSSGQSDPVATPQDHGRVEASLARAGFRRIRLEHFVGGHEVREAEVKHALRWFREMGKF